MIPLIKGPGRNLPSKPWQIGSDVYVIGCAPWWLREWPAFDAVLWGAGGRRPLGQGR